MSRVTTCHAAWLELVGDLLQARPGPREFPHERVADLLVTSFGAACCSLHTVDRAWVDHVVRAWPDGYLPTVPPCGLRPDATTHPLIRWYAVTGSSAPQVLERVPREVAPAAMAAEWSAFARPFGIARQLALPLRIGAGMTAYVLSRPDDDYGDADTELAALVLPALSALVGQHGVVRGLPDGPGDRARDAGLTERELAVLTLLGAGLTAQAIARRLQTSPRTVHKHLEHLYRKLGVRDRLMAVQRARDTGLLPPAPEPARIPSPRRGDHLTAR